MTDNAERFEPVMMALELLKPHPMNYQTHPPDQIEHIKQSIKQYGYYRNIVCARDYTLLAGHGAVIAARELGLTQIPVIRLDLDSDEPRAIKVLIGDNEINHLVERDDRLLSELLKQVHDFNPEEMLGTGFDDMMLANLVLVTRPASEIADKNEAAHWVGLPDYEDAPETYKVAVSFKSTEDRAEFFKRLDVDPETVRGQDGNTWAMWWPQKEKNDLASVMFDNAEEL